MARTGKEDTNATVGSIEESSLISAVKTGELTVKKYNFDWNHCNEFKNMSFLWVGNEETVSPHIENGANISQISGSETALNAAVNTGIDCSK